MRDARHDRASTERSSVREVPYEFSRERQRREQETYRIPAWWQAARQLYIFIRQRLRRAETASSLTVKADLIRLDRIFFDRITMFFNGETVTVTPLSMTDPRAPEQGGCMVMQSTMALPTIYCGTANQPPPKQITGR